MATDVTGILPAGSAAPEFSLPALRLLPGGGFEPGGAARVPDPAAAGPTLLVFFKNTCPTCRLTLPFVQRIHERTAARGARVVAVSQDGLEGTASFARELGLTMPVLVDGAHYPVSRRYDLVSVPTLYLLRPDGSVARGGMGFDRRGLEAMAADLAAAVGAPDPALFLPGEPVPDFKPG